MKDGYLFGFVCDLIRYYFMEDDILVKFMFIFKEDVGVYICKVNELFYLIYIVRVVVRDKGKYSLSWDVLILKFYFENLLNIMKIIVWKRFYCFFIYFFFINICWILFLYMFYKFKKFILFFLDVNECE